jgi:hypothetical protein
MLVNYKQFKTNQMKKFHIFIVLAINITIVSCKTTKEQRREHRKTDYVNKCPNWNNNNVYFSGNYKH